MAIKLIGTKKLPNPIGDDSCEVLTAKEFLCDTDADFADLPECCPSSMAVSIASGKVYVVNTTGAWVEFGTGAGGSNEPEKIKMFKTIMYASEDDGYQDFAAMIVTYGADATNAAILPTKTTDDILESDPQNGIMHFYYIEDENDIFMYGDMAGTGTPDWVSLSVMSGGEMGVNGAVEDISEITEAGYYAYVYYIEPGKNFTLIRYNPDAEAAMTLVPYLMEAMEIPCIFEETVLPTKTTDDIKITDPSTGVAYIYYIEDENVAAVYVVDPPTGETMWWSIDEVTGGMPCLGVITDKSEATDPNGYYVLMY